MADSAAIAELLWDHWLPRNVKALVAEALPKGPEDARLLAVWCAAVHDIGKATPAFACQVGCLADTMRRAGLDMPSRDQLGDDRRQAPHSLAGQLLLGEWLRDRFGWVARATRQFAVVVGGHHGVPPSPAQVLDLEAHPELLRTPGSAEPVWRQVQTELLDACADACGVSERLADWEHVKLSQPAQVALTALVIVSDWIASNADLFPYYPKEESTSHAERVAAAWRGLRLPPPWTPSEPTDEVDRLFATRFDLPSGARVRPVQAEAVRLARSMPAPGLMVIEAPMGEGKTEAALAVAEIFAARSGAGGAFVALPTMATSNAMFSRLLNWMDRLPPDGPDGAFAEGRERSVLLAHSKAALNDDYAELLRASGRAIRAVDQFGDEGERRPTADKRRAPAELVAHQWLRGRKKGLLASFAVGTIDQLLMAALKSRHLALRHLAFAGKVVVIDEAHAYDAWMNTYLDRVLSWLGAYGVPVVVLSATLPAGRRRELAEAYLSAGRRGATECAALADADAYPLLTAVAPGSAPVTVVPAASGRSTEVRLERLDDDLALLADRLDRELVDGGCAVVVRNTVDRVLETADCLRERFGDEAVTVAHARFLDADRAARDADLVARFGPPEGDGRNQRRPRGRHIVVASQVVEQSLDVDFDLLVTDLCPVDLLLQRMGRLHRHRRTRPARLATPRCLVTGVDWSAEPAPRPVRGSCRVYGEYALLRSLAVLEPHLFPRSEAGGVVRLPQDISPLVQRAYGDEPQGPQAWAETGEEARREHAAHQARQRREADVFRLAPVGREGRALMGWLDAGAGDVDDTRAGRAQVRDGQQSLEVLVVRRRADGELTTVPWLGDGLGGLPLPVDAPPPARAARAVALSGLRLPHHFSHERVLRRAIDELEEFYVPAWQTKESHWLAGELVLVLDDGPDGECQTRLAGYRLRYSPRDGLRVTRDAASE